jgi:hypothetical protein
MEKRKKCVTHRPYSFPLSYIFLIDTPDIDYDAPCQQRNDLFQLDIFYFFLFSDMKRNEKMIKNYFLGIKGTWKSSMN